VHLARPDVICAAHSHTLYGRAFSALGKPLDIITQDSCVFYNVSALKPLSHHTLGWTYR
jgi:ribulose-5-phosphate 4-epimerase/fuculose-1-phosphate aldolase